MSKISVLAFLSLLALTSSADAHAMLERADPAVGSTVQTSPSELVLSFTEAIEPAFSSIEVRNSGGERVDIGKAVARAKQELTIPLKRLSPGSYKVNWHVLSVDTHRTEGGFSFRVGQ